MSSWFKKFRPKRSTRLFQRNASGSVMMIFSLSLPVLLLAAGGAVDMVSMLQKRNLMQSAADASALASAKGLSLVNVSNSSIEAVARAMALTYFKSSQGVSVNATVLPNSSGVQVTIRQPHKSYFGGLAGFTASEVSASATAKIVGQPHVCVLGLSNSEVGTISLEKASMITGQNCAVYSNSTNGKSIVLKQTAAASATFICSAGGVSGDSFYPTPLIDCPELNDPLGNLPEPYVGSCTETNLVVTHDTQLAPGVYCGGIEVRQGARLDIRDGVYIIKDGRLRVNDTAQLIGVNAALFFTGAGASMNFTKRTTISLSAPESGPLAGILMYASRSMAQEQFWIRSDNARTLVGTIYLPNGELWIETKQPVADQSAYTAIIAHSLRLRGEPNLVLNTNYNGTSVPGTGGVEGVDKPLRLTR